MCVYVSWIAYANNTFTSLANWFMKGQYGLQQAGTGDVTARPLVRAVLLDPFGVPAGDDHVSLDEKDIV